MDLPTQQVDFSLEDESRVALPTKEVWGNLVSLNQSYPSIGLSDSDITMGRQTLCNIRLDCPMISGKHCKIWRDDDIIFLQDVSTNGTWVNGQKLGKGNRVILNSGDEVMLIPEKKGKTKISYIFKETADEAKAEADGGPGKDYVLRETLGSGAFATVRLAVHKATGRKVAVKIIDKKRFATHTSQRKNVIMDEVNILKKVSHKNIIGIEDVYDTDSTLYICLELVTGGELFDKIVDIGKFSEEEARSIFAQMLDAIEYLHSVGIAHRDLKPENVLLKSKKENIIKLSDFGLSRVIGEGSFMKTMCGTPQYLAPEILTKSEQEGYTNAVDLWSLGVMLYILLCGYPPFDDNKPGTTIFQQIKEAQYTFLDEDWNDISEEAKDLIRNLIVVDAEKRLTASQAKVHPWLRGTKLSKEAKTDEGDNTEEEEEEEEEEDKVSTGSKRKRESKSSKDGEENKSEEGAQEKKKAKIEVAHSDDATEESDDDGEEEDEEEADDLPVCKYGTKCYRKNPKHFKEFSHPHLSMKKTKKKSNKKSTK